MSTEKLHIRSLKLENFRCFEKLSLTLHPRLNVFFGENGSGKSAILEAINIMLGYIIENLGKNSAVKTVINYNDINNDAQRSRIDMELSDSKIIHWTIEATKIIHEGSYRTDTAYKNEELKKYVNALIKVIALSHGIVSVPVFASYKAIRNTDSLIISEQPHFDFSARACYDDAISMNSDFSQFFMWFKEREDLENEGFRDEMKKIKVRLPKSLVEDIKKQYPGKSFSSFASDAIVEHFNSKYGSVQNKFVNKDNQWITADPQMQAVRIALEAFFPEFSDFSIHRKTRSFVARKKEKIVNLAQLSDGEKIYILLVGDIARRLAIANPDWQNPLEGEGVIIIDEIELHLHPKWHRMIISQLLKTFPNCQFIVTSHSPQVLGEVPAESVWILKEGEAPRHPKYSYGLTSAEILDGDMDAASRNADVTKALEDIDRLIDNEQFDEARASIKALAKITGHIPAIVGSNSYLTMMGQEQAEIEEE